MSRFLRIGVAAAMLTFGTMNAEAAPIGLVLYDSLGNTSGVIWDGSLGDLNPGDGIVSYSGTLGDWLVNAWGSTTVDAMRLNSLTASAITTSTLVVAFTGLDYTESSLYQATFASALQNGTAAYYAVGDPSNGPFSPSVGIAGFGPFVADGAVTLFDDQTVAAGPSSGPYSLTQMFQVTGNAGDGTFFGAEAALEPVPEPASLVLLGTGLAAARLCGARRRGRRS